jgi:hypothetical protein
LFFCGSTCKKNKNPNCNGKWDERLKITNNSASHIYIIHATGYPDTLISSIPNQNYRSDHIKYGTTDTNLELCSWESYFEEIPSGVLMIFVFKDTINKTANVDLKNIEYNVNKIIKYPFFKRYDLTYNQLQQLNWHLLYP